MKKISDYIPEELKANGECLEECYGAAVPFKQADIELRLDQYDSQETERPAVYREQNGCHFIVAKTDEVQYFSQFFYGKKEQFGTGKPFYNDLLDCVLTTLHVQVDRELQLNKAKDLNPLITYN